MIIEDLPMILSSCLVTEVTWGCPLHDALLFREGAGGATVGHETDGVHHSPTGKVHLQVWGPAMESVPGQV